MERLPQCFDGRKNMVAEFVFDQVPELLAGIVLQILRKIVCSPSRASSMTQTLAWVPGARFKSRSFTANSSGKAASSFLKWLGRDTKSAPPSFFAQYQIS